MLFDENFPVNFPTGFFKLVESTDDPTGIGVRSSISLHQLVPMKLQVVGLHRTTGESDGEFTVRGFGDDLPVAAVYSTGRNNKRARSVNRKRDVCFLFHISSCYS